MSILGNLLLLLAAIAYVVLATQFYTKPAPGGDYGVGHAWATIYLNLFFLIALSLVTLIIGSQGGFQWVHPSGGTRFFMVAGGMLLIVLFISVSAIAMKEGPKWLQMIARVVGMVAPVALLCIAMVLLNDGLKAKIPATWVQIPLKIMAGLGLLIFSFFILQRWVPSVTATFRHLTADPNELDSFQMGILQNIENMDLQKNLVLLLVHTDRQRHPVIRERALNKIKTRPDWAEELARRLDTGWAEEVFTFLASNDVPDKSIFPQAVYQGVLQEAKRIKEDVRTDRDIHQSQFDKPVRNVLETINKYEGMGVDYRPAVQELRNAFNTHKEIPDFSSKKALDKWLAAH